MTTPTVTAVMPFRNSERFLAEAIESVRAQTFSGWELLLGDDGSRDGGAEIARAYERQDPRIRVLEHPGLENRGAWAARSFAIREAQGAYVAFLDADDVWFPGKLAGQVEILKAHPELGLLYGASEDWYSWTINPADEDRDEIVLPGVRPDEIIEPPTLARFAYPLGQARSPCLSSLIFRREAGLKHSAREGSWGGCAGHEDEAFLARFSLHEKIWISTDCWNRCRQHPSPVTATTSGTRTSPVSRRHYLEWLEKYVRSEGIQDCEIGRSIAKALEPHRRPVRTRLRAALSSFCMTEITECSSFPSAEKLLGASIDLPRAGQRMDSRVVTAEGWVLGRSSPAVAVEVAWGDGAAALFSPGLRRPDVAAVFPERSGSMRSGFRAILKLGENRRDEVRIGALLENGMRMPIGAIRGTRRWMKPVEAWKFRVKPMILRFTALFRRRDRGNRPVGGVGLGDLRRLEPFSRKFGFDRGTPIDRYYIECFLARQAESLRGRTLEIGGDTYTRRFGGGRVSRADVLNIREGDPRTTLVADLTDAAAIPSGLFDCIILTQTLPFIFDVRSALATLHRFLKDGGTLLASVPGVSPLSEEALATQFWTFTELSVRGLFEEAFGRGSVEIETHGNVLAAVAFLEGLAAEELTREQLETVDPRYQVVILAKAVKGPS